MKVTPSPLVSEMRGKTAGLVMATWKGIQYCRMFVIPGNPQTDAQTAVRTSLARCVTLWRSLPTVVKTWLDEYYSDYAMSGFNGFVRLCRALEQADSLLVPVPPNPYIPAVTGFTAVDVAGPGVKIDWTDPAIDDFSKCFVTFRESGENVFKNHTLILDAADETWERGNFTDAIGVQCYLALYNDTTGDIGTAASVLSV